MDSSPKEKQCAGRAGRGRPRARVEGLVTREVADETLVYDTESHRAVCLNKTAALVWRSCDGRRSARGSARRVSEARGEAGPEEVGWRALDQLGRDKLLETRAVRPEALAGLSRRDLIRRAGITAAVVALPLVTSIIAPTPAQAASCLPSGAACSAGAQCCSGTCNGEPNGTCL